MVFDIFCDSIYFILWFMYFDLRISAGNRIYFSVLLFFLENRALSNTNSQLFELIITLRSLLDICGESNFSLNLLFSIMSSKSISTFFPLWRLRFFFSSFYRFASSIFMRRSSLFFSIFLISSRWRLFFSPAFIFKKLIIKNTK